MPDYPRVFRIEPIGEWPGELTLRRQMASFKTPSRMENGRYHGPERVPVGKTMRELATEFEALKAKEPRLLIAVNSGDITLDGRLKAGRKPWHPGVILVFDSPRGEQRYPSDQYTHWEDNLRAIALTLNALRALDRWGVTHGQQYGGFLAIESAIALGTSAPFSDWKGARDWLLTLPAVLTLPAASSARDILRAAQRSTHPDLGGDADQFRFVTLAEKLLREANEL